MTIVPIKRRGLRDALGTLWFWYVIYSGIIRALAWTAAAAAFIVCCLALAWATWSGKRTVDAARWWLESPDMQGIVANLTVVTRHADRALAKADAVSDAAKASADESVKTQKAVIALVNAAKRETLPVATAAMGDFGALAVHTDRSINAPDGLVAQLRATLETIAQQVIEIAASGKAGLDESTLAMHNLAELLGDPHVHETLANIDKGTGAFAAAGTTVEGILEDLRHPEKPSKFVRAVSIMLQILRGTALAGQSAPVFGR